MVSIEAAEAEAEQISTTRNPLGGLGTRFNRRSPFLIGMAAAAGVALTYGLVLALTDARPVLTMIGVSLFLAIGLEPVVNWLIKHRFPRWVAVTTVSLCVPADGGPVGDRDPAAGAAGIAASQAPDYLRQAQDHSSALGRLNDRFQLQQHLTDAVKGSAVLSSLVGAVTLVVTAITDLVIVAVLTIFFLADMPQLRATFYRFIPAPRRPRAILIGDEILGKVGAYVLGNVIISVITAIGTLIWLEVFRVPYPLLLAIFVAVFDLIPVVGSTIAGVGVAAVALTVSLPVCIATIVFFIAFRLIEDYVLVPRIIGKAVEVPALVTVVAVLIGGAVFGIIGALVAIPPPPPCNCSSGNCCFPASTRPEGQRYAQHARGGTPPCPSPPTHQAAPRPQAKPVPPCSSADVGRAVVRSVRAPILADRHRRHARAMPRGNPGARPARSPRQSDTWPMHGGHPTYPTRSSVSLPDNPTTVPSQSRIPVQGVSTWWPSFSSSSWRGWCSASSGSWCTGCSGCSSSPAWVSCSPSWTAPSQKAASVRAGHERVSRTAVHSRGAPRPRAIRHRPDGGPVIRADRRAVWPDGLVSSGWEVLHAQRCAGLGRVWRLGSVRGARAADQTPIGEGVLAHEQAHHRQS